MPLRHLFADSQGRAARGGRDAQGRNGVSSSIPPEFSPDRELRELILAAEQRGAWSSRAPSVSRRSFLKLAGVAAGGLVIAFSLRPRPARAKPDEATQITDEFAPNAF